MVLCKPGGRVVRELDFNYKVLNSNLSLLPDERSNRETSRRIVFYSIHFVNLLKTYHDISFMVNTF